jgi:predicted ATPase
MTQAAVPAGEGESSGLPPWAVVLRAVREACGITQGGWGARLGYSTKTVQRWERGETVPDAAAEAALLALLEAEGLLRSYTTGPLHGQTLTAERVRQLLADVRGGLRTPLRPLAKLAAVQRPAPGPPLSRLPTTLTSFIGREQELVDLAQLLGTARLVTLTGPGGSGKTRLAIEAGRPVVDRFPDGVWIVDLSGVSDPTGVLPAIAQVLGVTETAGSSLAVALAAYLRHRQLLLVLDNFEQVVEAALNVYDLLVAAPQLTVLVTSRTLLRVEGEQEYAVAPLPLPDAGLGDSLAALAQNPAVQLFVARAAALGGGFTLTTENAPAVAELCRRLEGLPLVLELAAARVKLFSPAALLARLDRHLPLLTGGARSLPARQQTLRATIAWSWDLLAPAEQVLVQRLGVFAGGWTLKAAEAVCNPQGKVDVLDALAALVDQNLVQQREVAGESRFSMLATLREFALEQLAAAGEAAALRERHAAYLTGLAEAADATYWKSGHLLTDLLTPLDRDRDDLTAALTWAVEQQATALGLRLVGALGQWFFVRAPGEGRRWLAALLALPGADGPSQARGRALSGGAASAAALLDVRDAAAWWEDASADLRAVEDRPVLSYALGMLAIVLPLEEGARAAAFRAEALAVAQAVGEFHLTGWITMLVANGTLVHHGDLTVARTQLESALRVARTLGADWLEMMVLFLLGWVAGGQGRVAEAAELFEAGLPLGERLGVRVHLAQANMGLARLVSGVGDAARAAAAWQRALTLTRDLGGNRPQLAMCLAGIARLLCAGDDVALAVRLLAATDTDAGWWEAGA